MLRLLWGDRGDRGNVAPPIREDFIVVPSRGAREHLEHGFPIVRQIVIENRDPPGRFRSFHRRPLSCYERISKLGRPLSIADVSKDGFGALFRAAALARTPSIRIGNRNRLTSRTKEPSLKDSNSSMKA